METAQKEVVIYSTPTCHFCHMAKDFMQEHGVSFTDYDVSVDAEKRQEAVAISDQMGVPVIKIGNDIIVGFDKMRIAELLGITLETA